MIVCDKGQTAPHVGPRLYMKQNIWLRKITICHHILATKKVDIGFASKVSIVVWHLSDLVEFQSVPMFSKTKKVTFWNLKVFFVHFFQQEFGIIYPNHLSFHSFFIFIAFLEHLLVYAVNDNLTPYCFAFYVFNCSTLGL